MTQTHWLPGIIVLAIGLAIGVAFLFRLRLQSARPGPDADGRLADLERAAQLILDQLKELVADRHHLEAAQFDAEKNRLEQEAAAALRARDEYARGRAVPAQVNEKAAAATATATAVAAPTPQGWLARHPQLKGGLWGAGVVLFFVALGLFLGQEQKPREDGASATSKTPPMASPGEPQEDPALKEAMANYQAHPDSVDAIATLCHELINRQEFQEATRLTERALGLDPFHIESRIHRAVLAAIEGNRENGEKVLTHLADAFPNAYEGRLYLGLLALQSGQQRAALDNFERYAAEAPVNEQPPRLSEGIEMLRRQLGKPAGEPATR